MVRAQIGGWEKSGPGGQKSSIPQGRTALMILRPLALVALFALPLLGCSQKITVCPIPAILNDTATVTVFRPGTAPDLANELYTVSLSRAEGDCVYNNSTGVVRASLELTFYATRAPSSDGAAYSVPYFVVVHEGSKVYSKHAYSLDFTFAPSAATATIKQAPDPHQDRERQAALELPVAGRLPADGGADRI
jgi:hypothetical protein